MKQLARANPCTQNALLTALIANTFLAPHAHNPHAVAALRISVDLRRYYPEAQAAFDDMRTLVNPKEVDAWMRLTIRS